MDLEKKIRSIHDLLQKKKFLQVKEELEKLLKKIPNNSYLLNLSGLTLQYLNDYKSAINFFILAIRYSHFIEIDKNNYYSRKYISC